MHHGPILFVNFERIGCYVHSDRQKNSLDFPDKCHKRLYFVCFFFCGLTSVNNFSAMSGQSHSFLGIKQYNRDIMCIAQAHSPVPMEFTLLGTSHL